mmetsp:Transcript_6256/g.8270  ORF Transcript_6256/g.8270 Transcript_6256/m.8270 type:complete len:87 (+) Transcript_6256:586-846(+)
MCQKQPTPKYTSVNFVGFSSSLVTAFAKECGRKSDEEVAAAVRNMPLRVTCPFSIANPLDGFSEDACINNVNTSGKNDSVFMTKAD